MTGRRKLPPITPLSQAFRRIAETRHRGTWVTVLWYPDGFWELSELSPSWYEYDITHERLRAVQVFVPSPIVRARDLARDVRDALKGGT